MLRNGSMSEQASGNTSGHRFDHRQSEAFERRRINIRGRSTEQIVQSCPRIHPVSTRIRSIQARQIFAPPASVWKPRTPVMTSGTPALVETRRTREVNRRGSYEDAASKCKARSGSVSFAPCDVENRLPPRDEPRESRDVRHVIKRCRSAWSLPSRQSAFAIAARCPEEEIPGRQIEPAEMLGMPFMLQIVKDRHVRDTPRRWAP